MATFGARSAHEVADLSAAIAGQRPDALLVDCMTWGATAVAEEWGGPWAQWFPFPLAMTSRDVRIFGPGLAGCRRCRPGSGPAGLASDARRRVEAGVLPGAQRDSGVGRCATVALDGDRMRCSAWPRCCFT